MVDRVDSSHSESDAMNQTAQKSSLKWILIAVVVVGMVIGVYWFTRPATGPGAGRGYGGQFAATVGIATVQRQDVPITLDALGTVVPLATSVVRPLVSGRLIEVLYKEGQMVKRGQVLARIDPAPFKLTLDQATGTLQRDQAQLDVARLTLKRSQTLLAQDSIAQQEVDSQLATVKQLEGTVLTDKAAVETARLNLGYSQITAPIDGRIGLRAVDVGNYVTPGDANGVATVTTLAPIDVVFALPSDDIAHVLAQQDKLGKQASLPVTVLDRMRTTTLAQGKFLTLDNQVDVQTGTVRAKARFDNVDQRLFPNQFVNVRLVVDTLKDALVVPSAAIRKGPEGDFVYVVTPERTAKVTKVVTGPAVGDQVSVTGVQLNDRVVIEGGDRLEDGASVNTGENAGASRSPSAARRQGWSQDKNLNQGGAASSRHHRRATQADGA